MTDRIGFIGLGAMGSAVAARLASRADLMVTDVRGSAVAAMAALGGRPATQQEIARDCDIVFLSLPRSEDVQRVLDGPAGLAATMRPGGVVVDMTTGDPRLDEAFAARLAARGIDFADAPVSGGPQAAAAGTLAILVGAAEDTKQRLWPVLELISDRVLHVGGMGAGHAVKLVNNMLSAANRMAAREAVAIAVRSGVDARTCIEAINSSSGRSYITESTYPRFLLDGPARPQDFRLSLMLKDVKLTLALAEHAGLEASIGSATCELLARGVATLGEQADINEFMDIPAGPR
jgi:3-hydroxyisobutyrate dehydrogenase